MPEETELVFTVSLGEKTFKVADLTEYSKNARENYAESNEITINVESEEHHDTIPVGYIISQDKEPGTELKKGDTVNVVISKGKEPQPVTKNINLDIVYSGNAEEGVAQEVIIYVEDMNRDADEPYTTFEMTEDTSVEIELTIAPGTHGRYQVNIDGTVVRDLQVPYE